MLTATETHTITCAQRRTLIRLQAANEQLRAAQDELLNETAAIVNEQGQFQDFSNEFLEGVLSVDQLLDRLKVVVADA